MSVGDAAIEVYQVFVGWAGQWYHASGRSAFQASLHYSPGGLTAANSDAAFAAFAPMRLSESQYWYAKAGLAFDCDLGGGLGWRAAIAGQATDSPLPDTEQLSIGGADAVRGYVADDGTFDTGVIARSELRLARWSSAGDPSTAFVLQPYVFADGGYAMTMHDSVAVGALSAGVGFDFALGTNLAGTVNAAHVLRDAPASSAGDWGVDFKVTGRY
jgi:hemolysin activation/secretion protein